MELQPLDKELPIKCNHALNRDNCVGCPPISKTKGRPKWKRLQDRKDLGRQVKTCGLCKSMNHNIKLCPKKEILSCSNEGKKKKVDSKGIDLNPVFHLMYKVKSLKKKNYFLSIITHFILLLTLITNYITIILCISCLKSLDVTYI